MVICRKCGYEVRKDKADRDNLLDALKAWQKYDTEAADKHPCPDYTLRLAYRNEARKLTEAAIAQAEKEG